MRCISSKHSIQIFFTAVRYNTMRNSNFLFQLLPSLHIWNTDYQRFQLSPIRWHSLPWNSGYTEHTHFTRSTSLAPYISLNIKQHPLLAPLPQLVSMLGNSDIFKELNFHWYDAFGILEPFLVLWSINCLIVTDFFKSLKQRRQTAIHQYWEDQV